MKKKQIAVFASGSGSNYQAIMEKLGDKGYGYEVVLLVCDKPGAKVIARAESFGTPVHVFKPKNYRNKAHYENELLSVLRNAGVEWIVLAGYMRLIGETLLTPYQGRILNIHPSLLPSFPGKDAVGQAFHAGVKVTGVTVHYVDAGMDTGDIIAQEAVKVRPEDTPESLQQRIQQIEHQLYPETIQSLLAPQKGEKINL